MQQHKPVTCKWVKGRGDISVVSASFEGLVKAGPGNSEWSGLHLKTEYNSGCLGKLVVTLSTRRSEGYKGTRYSTSLGQVFSKLVNHSAG